jgi:hypothetical protein
MNSSTNASIPLELSSVLLRFEERRSPRQQPPHIRLLLPSNPQFQRVPFKTLPIYFINQSLDSLGVLQDMHVLRSDVLDSFAVTLHLHHPPPLAPLADSQSQPACRINKQ